MLEWMNENLIGHIESNLYGIQLGTWGYSHIGEQHPLKTTSDGSDTLTSSFAGRLDPAYLMLGLGGNWT